MVRRCLVQLGCALCGYTPVFRAMMPVRVQQDVLDYLRKLPAQSRHVLRLAIKAVAQERGDIKSLVDDLEGFHRRRVGSHRVIFEYEIIEDVRTITRIFAGPRQWIYEVFQNRLSERVTAFLKLHSCNIDVFFSDDTLSIMKTASVADLRNHFTRIAKWIEEGQPITITRRGQTFATLSPARKKKAQAAWPDLAARRSRAKVTPEILEYARGAY